MISSGKLFRFSRDTFRILILSFAYNSLNSVACCCGTLCICAIVPITKIFLGPKSISITFFLKSLLNNSILPISSMNSMSCKCNVTKAIELLSMIKAFKHDFGKILQCLNLITEALLPRSCPRKHGNFLLDI